MLYEILSFADVAIPLGMAWSSPFARWQGSLAGASSLDVAAGVTSRALAARQVTPDLLEGLVLGATIPEPGIMSGPAALAARLGAGEVSGPMVSQACATSVACLAVASGAVNAGAGLQLVVAADLTSNGLGARPDGDDGTGQSDRMLDGSSWSPWAGEAVLAMAEQVAAEAGISRAELDDLAVLRFTQYGKALAAERAFQRRYMVGAQAAQQAVDADEGVRPSGTGQVAALAASAGGGRHTSATRACPADGAAGALVTTTAGARELAPGAGVARILAVAFARCPGRMPQAAVPAAQAALEAAGLGFRRVDAVTTHSPFAVSDIYFSRQAGIPVEKMNSYGCSLIYGHPQAPTGLRSLAELIEELRLRGGGTGVFAGCGSGDTGAAIAVRVDD